ncbi:MAG: RNA-binding protein [Candidatus Aenigmarchaeota archaeon]|nr:RNA-binding protein [Candidatus Aenigmarchaeota archaeon]
MTEGLLKNERDFVVPGDRIVNSLDYLPGRNCYREGDSIYSKRLGIVSVANRVVSVIALCGPYVPRVGDMVIGEVEEIQSNGWILNINAPYMAYMPLSGVREYIDTAKSQLSSYYNIGDVMYAKVSQAQADSVQVTLQDTRARKFHTGRVVTMSPSKVPRLIGKDGSMIIMIKDRTGCRITVGQNGLVWIEGEREEQVIEIIRFVEKEAAHEGLTDKVGRLLGVQPGEYADKGREHDDDKSRWQEE